VNFNTRILGLQARACASACALTQCLQHQFRFDCEANALVCNSTAAICKLTADKPPLTEAHGRLSAVATFENIDQAWSQPLRHAVHVLQQVHHLFFWLPLPLELELHGTFVAEPHEVVFEPQEPFVSHR